MSRNKNGTIVLGVVLFGLAILIIVSRHLFPLFFLGGILSFIFGVILGVWEHFTGSWENNSHYLLIMGIILLFISSVFYFLGYSFGDSSLGKDILQIYYAFTGAQEEISNAEWLTIEELVNSTCKELDENSCNQLRNFAKTAKSIKEVQEKIEQIKEIEKIKK